MPEFVFPVVPPGSLLVEKESKVPGGYWSQRVIVSNLDWIVDPKSGIRSYEPLTADIYVWNGSSFQVRKTVPWKERFELQ